MADCSSLDCRLHSAWLTQLIREHESLCYQYGIGLSVPVFRINKSRNQLGSWSASDRLLTLSHHLIAEHPWSLTLRVLKHEMAHQLCSELYGQDDAGHGPVFQKACHQLGLEEPFRRAGADLSAEFPSTDAVQAATEPGRHIIEKVRKLLKLGESANEHEAALAMQRACELLDRYQLDFASLAEEQQLVHRSVNTGKQKMPTYRKVICSLLDRYFGVQVVCDSTYIPMQDCSQKTIELLGPEENVAIAEHCYHFLENRLETLWQQNRKRFVGGGLRARNSYFLGILTGFRERLEQERSQVSAAPAGEDTPSLVPVAHAAKRLEDFVSWRFPCLRRKTTQTVQVHGAAYQQAVETGRTLQLRRPVEDVKGTKLLP